ncbi:MAG: hypothetical protein IT559_00640 [Alphaproteobacteria bacterium]|nr:hypothetical protein [Alphaproteobacteria bacterium]
MAYAPITAFSACRNEFVIYVYHWPENHLEGQGDWEMRSVSGDLETAMMDARRLYDTRNFRRVEIQQRFFMPMGGEERGFTRSLKTFTHDSSLGENMAWWGVTGAALITTIALASMAFLHYQPVLSPVFS